MEWAESTDAEAVSLLLDFKGKKPQTDAWGDLFLFR